MGEQNRVPTTPPCCPPSLKNGTARGGSGGDNTAVQREEPRPSTGRAEPPQNPTRASISPARCDSLLVAGKGTKLLG